MRDTSPRLFTHEDLPLFTAAQPATAAIAETVAAPPRRFTLAELVNRAYPDVMHGLTATERHRVQIGDDEALPYGDRYQNGVRPGPRKLAQFVECLRLQNTPKTYSQDDLGDDAVVHVKLFDPSGAATWFLTEWSHDPKDPIAFGPCYIHEAELGYVDLRELAEIRGRFGIGIELDMHWKPRTLREVRAERGFD